MPILSIALSKPKPDETTPMEPIIEALLAKSHLQHKQANNLQMQPRPQQKLKLAHFFSDKSLTRFDIISD